MTTNLEVDGFEIGIDELYNAIYGYGIPYHGGMWLIVHEVMRNLTPESKRRFEEYQEQNDPCRG